MTLLGSVRIRSLSPAGVEAAPSTIRAMHANACDAAHPEMDLLPHLETSLQGASARQRGSLGGIRLEWFRCLRLRAQREVAADACKTTRADWVSPCGALRRVTTGLQSSKGFHTGISVPV